MELSKGEMVKHESFQSVLFALFREALNFWIIVPPHLLRMGDLLKIHFTFSSIDIFQPFPFILTCFLEGTIAIKKK